MNDKSPAFQFYPKDFLTDGKQIRMPLAACGAYIRLLCQCWLDGSLPTDMKELGRLCGATSRQMHELWPAIEPCFLARDGHYVHLRLEKERLKQQTFRQRQSDKGIASAAMRATLAKAATERQPESNRASTEPQPIAPKSNSPISDLQSPISTLQRFPERAIALDAAWEAFKAAYPAGGREGGFMAQQHFIAGCEADGYPAVMAGLDRYKRSKKVADRFVMGMEKWLEKKLWIQEPEAADTSAGDVTAMADHLAKIDAEKATRGR